MNIQHSLEACTVCTVIVLEYYNDKIQKFQFALTLMHAQFQIVSDKRCSTCTVTFVLLHTFCMPTFSFSFIFKHSSLV